MDTVSRQRQTWTGQSGAWGGGRWANESLNRRHVEPGTCAILPCPRAQASWTVKDSLASGTLLRSVQQSL
jgi:hypothetical protein